MLTDFSDEMLLEIFLRVTYTPSNFQAIQQTCHRFYRIIKTESLPRRTAMYQFRPLMLLTSYARGATSIDWDLLRSIYPIFSNQLDLLDSLQSFSTAHRDIVYLGIVLADFLVTCRTTFYWTTNFAQERTFDLIGFSRITRYVLPPAAIMLLRFTSALVYRARFLQSNENKDEDNIEDICLIDANYTNMHCLFSFYGFEGDFLSRPSKIYNRSPELWQEEGQAYRDIAKRVHRAYEKGRNPRVHGSMNIKLLALHRSLARIAGTGCFLNLAQSERQPVEGELPVITRIAKEEYLMHHLNEQVRRIFEDHETAFRLLGDLDLELIGQQIQEVYKTVSGLTDGEAETALRTEMGELGLDAWP